MAKDQVNVRLSEATREKLDYLTERHGTQTEAVAVAIDRLYQAEMPRRNVMTRTLAVCKPDQSLFEAAEQARLTSDQGYRVSTDRANTGQGWIQPKPREDEVVVGTIRVRPSESFYVYRRE